jgi:hypothetical protein
MAQARHDPVVTRRGWIEMEDGPTLTVARDAPVIWDVEAGAALPEMGRRRLAHAVRQDLWRTLRDLRGFRPAVAVTRGPKGLCVRAGGAVAGRVPAGTRERIGGLLEDPVRRAAWLRFAGHRR